MALSLGGQTVINFDKAENWVAQCSVLREPNVTKKIWILKTFKCHSCEEYLAIKRVSIKSELQIISQGKSIV